MLETMCVGDKFVNMGTDLVSKSPNQRKFRQVVDANILNRSPS